MDNSDIVASCDAHTAAGTAWSAMGRELEPSSTYVMEILHQEPDVLD